MTLGWALLMGFGLGLRHATDADHLVAIGTLLQREAGARRAARLAVLWGLGHTVAFLGVGLLIVAAGLRMPAAFEQITSLLVAGMLVGLGIWHIRRSLQGMPVQRSGNWRPIVIGLIHGLAGSAAIALLALTTIASVIWAVAYLILFGVGTVVGMAVLTMLMAWPIAWSAQREQRFHQLAITVAGGLSIAIGLMLAMEAVIT